MGKDSIEPFLKFKDKHTILLAYTSNKGASDFQNLEIEGKTLYLKVIETSKTWNNNENLMYVVGATQAKSLLAIREQLPNRFLLVHSDRAQERYIHEVRE